MRGKFTGILTLKLTLRGPTRFSLSLAAQNVTKFSTLLGGIASIDDCIKFTGLVISRFTDL